MTLREAPAVRARVPALARDQVQARQALDRRVEDPRTKKVMQVQR